MKRIALLILIIVAFTLNGKVPFTTLYLEIEKIRYEGEAELIQNTEDNADKLKKYVSTQKIWVNVKDDSYLMIEEPEKGNELIEKYGKLKFQGRHYTLDYGLNFAWDGTDVPSERIYDNYTTEVPNYLFYKAKLAKKVKITLPNGSKFKAHLYAYINLDPADEDQTNAYISEIESSDMPKEDKDAEIKLAQEALEKKAMKFLEWIWVDDEGNELQMFLRKHETSGTVKVEYNVTKVTVDKDFDNEIFEKTLSAFKVKQVKG